jgi:hypothetical protein
VYPQGVGDVVILAGLELSPSPIWWPFLTSAFHVCTTYSNELPSEGVCFVDTVLLGKMELRIGFIY